MLQEGDYAKAIESFNREPIDFMRLTGLAIAYNKLGQQETAQQCLDELTALEGETASYQYAQVYAQWGDAEKALDALEHAWDIGDSGVILMNMDERLDPLRAEPRFVSLLEKWRDPSKR